MKCTVTYYMSYPVDDPCRKYIASNDSSPKFSKRPSSEKNGTNFESENHQNGQVTEKSPNDGLPLSGFFLTQSLEI